VGADDAIIDAILVREGDKVAPPDRSGRISRWGITAAALSEHRGHSVTDAEISQLSVTEARDIYQTMYIFKPSFHLLGSEVLRATLVDYGVNSGTSTAVKAMQHALGVVPDGIIGAETLRAANLKDGSRLSIRILCQRSRMLARLVHRDSTQVKYLEGWIDRVMDQVEALV